MHTHTPRQKNQFVQSISEECYAARPMLGDLLTFLAAAVEEYPGEAASPRWVTAGINPRGAAPRRGSSVRTSWHAPSI